MRRLPLALAAISLCMTFFGCGGSASGNLQAAESATKTALTSSANPSIPAETVTFTATVTASGGTPSGTVTFTDGSSTLGTGTVNDSGVATVTAPSLSAGTHNITASYGGGSGFLTSTSSALSQLVLSPRPGAIPGTFFGLNIGPSSPWPTSQSVEFGVWRSLGAELRWSDLQPNAPAGGAPTADPTDASYDWSTLDKYVPQATTNGQEILFTAYYTPVWISQQPSSTCQANTSGNQTTGGCYPPSDVGSGDNYWKDFLTALYQHVTTTDGAHIAVWECWNEPNISSEYAGVLSDLNTMCQDLRSTIIALDSTAKFTTPAPTGPVSVGAGNARDWLNTWITSGYSNDADYIAFHGYVCTSASACTASDAELVATQVVGPIQAMLATNGVNKPLWDTEGSDDVADLVITDPDLHAAFYARHSLLQQQAVSTFAYWGWNFGFANLIDPNTGVLNTAGIAWQQIYSWTVGATYTQACAQTAGTVYTCKLTDKSGNPELIVWDSQDVSSCSNDVCGSTSFSVPSGFTKCTDMAGATCTNGISGGTVTVGAKPALLQ